MKILAIIFFINLGQMASSLAQRSSEHVLSLQQRHAIMGQMLQNPELLQKCSRLQTYIDRIHLTEYLRFYNFEQRQGIYSDRIFELSKNISQKLASEGLNWMRPLFQERGYDPSNERERIERIVNKVVRRKLDSISHYEITYNDYESRIDGVRGVVVSRIPIYHYIGIFEGNEVKFSVTSEELGVHMDTFRPIVKFESSFVHRVPNNLIFNRSQRGLALTYEHTRAYEHFSVMPPWVKIKLRLNDEANTRFSVFNYHDLLENDSPTTIASLSFRNGIETYLEQNERMLLAISQRQCVYNMQGQ